MELRFGRNDPCWCGSGKKFKKCHLNRESAPRRSIREVIEIGQTAYKQELCLHPDPSTCKGRIIRAHSIQQNSGMSCIAVKGKVYGISENNVGDLSKTNGLIAPKLVGIGSASTFTGMCGFHDDQTFAPIEKKSFDACPEHAFLLAYRHFCKEVFTKRAAASLFSHLKSVDAGKPFLQQVALQHFLKVMQSGFSQGSMDAEQIKARYDSALLAKDYSAVCYYVVRFKEVPDILVCSGNFPTFDFAGNQLQTLLELDKLPDHVTFSIIATDSGGAAVFSWLGDLICPKLLVKSLHQLPDADIGDAMVRHAFEYCENVYMNPIWWDELDDVNQMALRRRITEAADFTVKRRSNCLFYDGQNYVNWTVTSRESNIVL